MYNFKKVDEATGRATDDVSPGDDVEDNTHLFGENQIGKNGRQEMVERIKEDKRGRKDNSGKDVKLHASRGTAKSINQTVQPYYIDKNKEIII